MSEKFENENEFDQNSNETQKSSFEFDTSSFVFPSSATDDEYMIKSEPTEDSFKEPVTEPFGSINEEPTFSTPSYTEPIMSSQNPYGSNNQQYGYGSNQNSYSQQNNQYGAPNQQFTPYGYNQPPKKPKKSGKGKAVVAIVILVAIVVALASLLGPSVIKMFSKNPAPNTVVAESSNGESVSSDMEATIDYSTTAPSNVGQLTAVQVAEKVRPSVVGVMTYKNGQLSGEGSGVVMGLDSTGKSTYIITCAHVISDNGVTYGILTLDGKRYEASMIAYDTRTDIGVLKVETTELTAAEFGDSSTLKVGETVYAIGNPGGSEYFGSITDGIISAIDRSISSTYTMTCIQHNAAINPGNSGGALVNSAGQVIGINSSKIAATDFEGMGFAIPMSTVKPIVENLVKYHYVPNRPKLGIQYASVDSYQLYSMVVAIKGLPKGSLIISAISNDSSLAKTKAEVGDLIIAVNGKDMDDSSVLLDMIDKGAVGDTLTLTLCRVENRTYKTSTFNVTITLVEDKGEQTTEPTSSIGGYNYGGASSFEDFFKNYFGFDW